MIEFRETTIDDKEWIDPLLKVADLHGCHQNFTNIFAWSQTYIYRVARVNDYLVVKGIMDNAPYYFYPAGTGDIKPVFELMKQDAAENGHPFVIVGASPENMAVLKELYPEHFEFKEFREGFDYVYLLEKLAKLSGNALHSKKNHVNRFLKVNSDWAFEIISQENLAECWEMNRAWCKENDNSCEDNGIHEETCAVRCCFRNFEALKLDGGLIRLNGKVVAYTMGESLNSDTYVIHIEKAFSDIAGAYQMINQQFAALIKEKYPHIVYVNREEDMGIEGLRKAKLSYHPDHMEEKYSATYFEE